MRARFIRALVTAAAVAGGAAAAASAARAEAVANPLQDTGVLRVREAFSVDGIALLDLHAQHAARMGVCAASVFAGLKWCVSGTGEESKGEATYVKTTGYNIDAENRIVYAISTRRGYPLKADGFDAVVQSIGARFGAGAAVYALRAKGTDGAEASSLIAVWGGLRLVHLSDAEYAVVEGGGSLKRGHLVDHRFNLVASAKAREPVYKIEGEAGYILHFMTAGPERADIIARVVYAPAFLPPPLKPADVPGNPIATDAVKPPKTPAGNRAADRGESRDLAAERGRRAESERALAAERLLREEAERKIAEMKRALEELKKRSQADRKDAEQRADAEQKPEAARKAEAERQAETERKAAADQKAAAERKAEADRKSAEERRQKEEAERKSTEGRRAAAERERRAEAARKAAEEKRIADEKRAAAERRAADEKRAREEAARKSREPPAAHQGGPEDGAKADDEAARRREADRDAERRERAERQAEAERKAEADRAARDRANRDEDWYRRAAEAASGAGASWSGSESSAAADDRRIIAQAIFAGADGAGIEIVFECAQGADRRLRATARGFDRNTGSRVPFRSEGEGAFRVKTRVGLDGKTAEDGFLFRESDDDMVSIVEAPLTSADISIKAARAEAWLRHHTVAIEFRLMAGTVAATVAPYAPNLRKVLEACVQQ